MAFAWNFDADPLEILPDPLEFRPGRRLYTGKLPINRPSGHYARKKKKKKKILRRRRRRRRRKKKKKKRLRKREGKR